MRRIRVQETLVQALRIAGRVVRSAVATDFVVVNRVELSVVKDVERFGAELEIFGPRDVELLEQTRIEICPRRIHNSVELPRQHDPFARFRPEQKGSLARSTAAPPNANHRLIGVCPACRSLALQNGMSQ